MSVIKDDGFFTGVRRVFPVQLLTFGQLEHLDTLWPLPRRTFRAITALCHRARDRLSRYSPRQIGGPSVNSRGYSLGKYHEAADREFQSIGPSLFLPDAD
jgi:hypothetical protein